MAWSYKKRIKVAPGVHLNISKSGVSTSMGSKGMSIMTSIIIVKKSPRLAIVVGVRVLIFLTQDRRKTFMMEGMDVLQ